MQGMKQGGVSEEQKDQWHNPQAKHLKECNLSRKKAAGSWCWMALVFLRRQKKKPKNKQQSNVLLTQSIKQAGEGEEAGRLVPHTHIFDTKSNMLPIFLLTAVPAAV